MTTYFRKMTSAAKACAAREGGFEKNKVIVTSKPGEYGDHRRRPMIAGEPTMLAAAIQIRIAAVTYVYSEVQVRRTNGRWIAPKSTSRQPRYAFQTARMAPSLNVYR